MTTAVLKPLSRHGAIAQLVEHLHGMQGVRSSCLLGSILLSPVPDWVFLFLGAVKLAVFWCLETWWARFWARFGADRNFLCLTVPQFVEATVDSAYFPGKVRPYPMELLPTPAAARALGRSPQYLKRLRDTHGGFLVLGKHYFEAPSRNAAITWDVQAVNQELCKRSVLDRKKLADG